jgi:hypothetical protein
LALEFRRRVISKTTLFEICALKGVLGRDLDLQFVTDLGGKELMKKLQQWALIKSSLAKARGKT